MRQNLKKTDAGRSDSKRRFEAFSDFTKKYLNRELPGKATLNGDRLFFSPLDEHLLNGIRVLRPGLEAGVFKKDRFEPSHALALFLKPQEFRNTYLITPEQAAAYIRGEMLEAGNECGQGWVLLCIMGKTDSYSFAFGKNADGRIKNHYPKGLRKLYYRYEQEDQYGNEGGTERP